MTVQNLTIDCGTHVLSFGDADSYNWMVVQSYAALKSYTDASYAAYQSYQSAYNNSYEVERASWQSDLDARQALDVALLESFAMTNSWVIPILRLIGHHSYALPAFSFTYDPFSYPPFSFGP